LKKKKHNFHVLKQAFGTLGNLSFAIPCGVVLKMC